MQYNTIQSQPESEPRRERHDPVVVDVQKRHLAELLASDEAKLKQDVLSVNFIKVTILFLGQTNYSKII
jgi:hypothetical protein